MQIILLHRLIWHLRKPWSCLSSRFLVLTEDYIEPIFYSTIGRPSQNWVCLRTLADIKLYFLILGKSISPQTEAKESNKIPFHV